MPGAGRDKILMDIKNTNYGNVYDCIDVENGIGYDMYTKFSQKMRLNNRTCHRRRICE